MVAQWLKIAGCDRVFIVDVEERKLQLARAMGLIPVNARQRTVLAEMDRALQVAPLMTDKLPLSDGVRIFRELHDRSPYHNKVVFRLLQDI
jgi:threonine dehydrogenase-like Zn-dependent dehydrogenase